jgi:hypothetical protein
MEAEEDGIREELVLKEEKLLENGFRANAKKIEELIDDNCIEIAESGKQSSYRSGDNFENADGELYIISDTIKCIYLSENCRLLVYTAAKVKKNVRMKSSCSSIWKKSDDKWKMVFHHRTSCDEQ